jgi:hypothetical protein
MRQHHHFAAIVMTVRGRRGDKSAIWASNAGELLRGRALRAHGKLS